ncbi:hypothetical protein Y032_0317g2304 [Ancylostoma ceylanicum]|uniref:Uncharacterized protein n=1 Tax=Ancylostoma ceylanicum TaxID=53326 RepID=A0A016S1H2_9BILA|nr:hypothetical protein Y032_0317g2304 [Ancylostoma ceylanicum]
MPVYVTVVLVIIMLSLSSNVSARSNHPASTAGKYLGKFAQTYEEPEKFYEDLREHDKEETATTPNSYNFRLPKHLKPLSYDLVIKVYLPHYVEFPANKNLTTEGEVTIKMVVMQTTNTIALNMRKIILLFDKCEARSNTIPLTITDINVEEQFERVIFFLAETLHVGQEVSLKVVDSTLLLADVSTTSLFQRPESGPVLMNSPTTKEVLNATTLPPFRFTTI